MKVTISKQDLFRVILVTLLLGGVWGCKQRSDRHPIPQWVKVAKVSGADDHDTVIYPGKVKATEYVKLAFRVAGPLKKIYVGEGEAVKKGQLLAELDARDYQLQYDAVSAEYKQVTEESERIMELYRRGSVAINEYDKAVAARKRVTALYQINKNALHDTRLKAPFDGYIQKKYFSEPEIVNQGTPILSLLNDRMLEIEVDISAQDFIRYSDLLYAYAEADVFPGIRFPLEGIGVNQGANYNQLFTVRLCLEQDSLLRLVDGMSVTVTMLFRPDDERELTVVPISALFQQDGHSFVWLYNQQEQTIQKMRVEVQQMYKNGFVWVRSALKQGQMVISAGVNDLKEGQSVKLLPPVSVSNVGRLL